MDDAKLDELFSSCMPRLQQMARQMLRNHEDSEDALQEGLLSAFRNLGQFQGRSKFSSWLHSIVKNAARTHVRRMKSRPQYVSEEEFANGGESILEEISVDPGLSPEEVCARRERSRLLLEVLQDMPARYEAVVRLCDVDGVEPKEAAQKLGMTACALKTYLFRARRLATRRIRGRVFPPYESCTNNRRSCRERAQVSGLMRTVDAVRDFERAERQRFPMHARARKKFDYVGGNHETRRKRSRLWKYSLGTSVHSALHNARGPTC